MTIYGSILPGAASIARSARLAGNLSERAKQRLRVLDWYRDHGGNQSLTARHFGIDREAIRAWHRRLIAEGPRGLGDRSHRPHHCRQPTTSSEVVAAVVRCRKTHPAWSKYKIAALLHKESMETSPSTAGRILKRRGLIDQNVSRKRRRAAKHPRRRFPRGMKISSPGDMIQMDTKHLTLTGGAKLYQFTAVDVLSKQRVLRYYPSLASINGARFLGECLRSLPFLLRNIQTDNGPEFQKDFERRCRELGIPHYFTYPRHPKQNSYVEISHGADEREFYRQGVVAPNRTLMDRQLAAWEHTWNDVRPHQALNYLTPNEYFSKWQHGRLPTKDTITLQA